MRAEGVPGLAAGPASVPAPTLTLSVVVLQWDQEHHTRRCVESVRAGTDVAYELVVVDNGSQPAGRAYAAAAADVCVQHEDNRGFAGGMNAGLRVARGRSVAFINNDAVLPPGWASSLIGVLDADESIGIVSPRVSAARSGPDLLHGAGPVVLNPFDQPPSAVVWVMRTAVARALGGFDERFWPASAEDLDLAFTAWVNDLDVVVDTRVLVQHVGKGTAGTKLHSWRQVWRDNGALLLDKWTDTAQTKPRLDGVTLQRHARNTAIAASMAGWMRRYYDLRERRVPGRAAAERVLGRARIVALRLRPRMSGAPASPRPTPPPTALGGSDGPR